MYYLILPSQAIPTARGFRSMAHGVTTKSTYNWWFQLRYLSQHGRGKFFRYRAISAIFGFDHTGNSSPTSAGVICIAKLLLGL